MKEYEMAKLTQREFLEQVIAENSKKTNSSQEDYEKALSALEEMKDNLCYSIRDISEKAVKNVEYDEDNIFPHFGKFREEDTTWVKDGDSYRRKIEEYQEAVEDFLKAVSTYIKCPHLHCSQLNSLLVVLFFYLKLRFFGNYYGYKILNPTSGWRYNLWGYLCGHWSLLVGTLTSGFILFPILIALGFIYPPEKVLYLPIIAGFLLVYKVARFIFDFAYYKLGFKNNIQKRLLHYAQIDDYLNNDVLQPKKLIEMASKIEDLPASINIIISYMDNDENIAYNNYGEFLKLYIEKKDEEYDDTEENEIATNDEDGLIISFLKKIQSLDKKILLFFYKKKLHRKFLRPFKSKIANRIFRICFITPIVIIAPLLLWVYTSILFDGKYPNIMFLSMLACQIYIFRIVFWHAD